MRARERAILNKVPSRRVKLLSLLLLMLLFLLLVMVVVDMVSDGRYTHTIYREERKWSTIKRLANVQLIVRWQTRSWNRNHWIVGREPQSYTDKQTTKNQHVLE